MVNRTVGILLALGTALALTGTMALAGAQATGHKHTMREMAAMPSMTRLEEASGKAFEVAFLSEMIEHHAGAVEMAGMATRSARRPEVKKAAQKVAASQRKGSAQMSAWLNAWYGQQPDPELRALMKKDMAPMMAAFQDDCRKDCDHAFLMHMNMHHQMGIDMAQMALEKSTHAELRQMARKMIADQAAEIAQFDAWLDTAHQH